MFYFSNTRMGCTRTAVTKGRLWSIDRVCVGGGGALEETKGKRERVGMMGELLTRHMNILVQGCQSNIAPSFLNACKHTHMHAHTQTHTPVLLCSSPDAPGGVQATQNSTEIPGV